MLTYSFWRWSQVPLKARYLECVSASTNVDIWIRSITSIPTMQAPLTLPYLETYYRQRESYQNTRKNIRSNPLESTCEDHGEDHAYRNETTEVPKWKIGQIPRLLTMMRFGKNQPFRLGFSEEQPVDEQHRNRNCPRDETPMDVSYGPCARRLGHLHCPVRVWWRYFLGRRWVREDEISQSGTYIDRVHQRSQD
jgi:hypothetical protein